MPDYSKDLQIDLTMLDVEWVNQPLLFMRYSEHAADSERNAKQAAEKVKIVRSELVNEAKSNPHILAGGKATDSVVEAYYREHPDHQAAKTEQIAAEYELETIRVAVFAFNQKKTALENLVRLHAAQYFAGPSVPRDAMEIMAQSAEQFKKARINQRARGKGAPK